MTEATTSPSPKRRTYTSASKVDTINNQLQAYVSGFGDEAGTAVLSELLQNADDAGASTVSFYFFSNHLEVRNNSSFTEQDFANITQLMSRGKENQAGKTGAFGTGFISTYHFTDHPYLASSGEWLKFDPQRDELEQGETDIKDQTCFRFQWRRKETEISRKIGARIWTDGDIQELRDQLGPVLYRLALFLRHVRSIDVYDASNMVLFRIIRSCTHTVQLQNGIRETWEISYAEGEKLSFTDTWLYYKTTIPADHAPSRFTVKDFTIALAFPIQSHKWIEEHIPALLYNLLPTSIRTGFGFQINGSFFPSDNRRNILQDATLQAEKVSWNQCVIQAIGELFVSSVADMREQIRDVERFYELFPLHFEEVHGFLLPIKDIFRQQASSLSIIRTTRGAWEKPCDVRRTPNSDLHALLSDYEGLLPRGVGKDISDLVKHCGGKEVTIDDLLNFIKPALASGVTFEAGVPHSIIDSRDKLHRLYKLFQDEFKQLKRSNSKQEYEKYVEQLRELPIFLSEDQRFYRGDEDHWCGNEAARDLGLGKLVRFVDRAMQDEFPFLMDVLLELSGSELLRYYVQDQLPKQEGLAVESENLPYWLRGRAQFVRILNYMATGNEDITNEDLAGLPIIMDEAGLLWSSRSIVRRPTNDSPELLRRLGLAFVDKELYEDTKIHTLYKQAGITEVSIEDVIILLEKSYSIDRQISDTDQPLQTLDDWRHLFEYLYRFVKTQPLSDRLNVLHIIPTMGQRLAAIDNSNAPLAIPEGEVASLEVVLNEILKIDVLVHPSVLKGNCTEFLKTGFGIESLSALTVARDYILPHYHDAQVSDDERWRLLQFLKNLLNDAVTKDDVSKLLQTKLDSRLDLVRCRDPYNNDCYASEEPVYYDTSLSRATFISGFWHPHESYDASWNTLLDLLGVKSKPDVADVAKRLLDTAAKGVEPVSDLYSAIEKDWGQLDKAIQQRLCESAIFWDTKQYWSAIQIHPDEHKNWFGQRRKYYSDIEPQQAHRILKRINAVSEELSWNDHLALLEEIAEAYNDGSVVEDLDRQLLYRNIAKLDPAQWPDAPPSIDDNLQANLRSMPFVLSTKGTLRAVDDPESPLCIAIDTTAIPESLTGRITFVDTNIARVGHGFLQNILHIDTVSPFVVVRDVFKQVYQSTFDDQERLELLHYLSAIWHDLKGSEKETLKGVLSNVDLVRVADCNYYQADQVSFASYRLDQVFVGGFGRPPSPHASYDIPKEREADKPRAPWKESPIGVLFQELGVHTSPRSCDVITAIEGIAAHAEHPNAALIAALQPLVQRINEILDDAEHDQKDSQELRRLAGIQWVPARCENIESWYLPKEVYLHGEENLVGIHAPIISLQRDPSKKSADLLGFLTVPPADLVAKHLLSLGQQKPSKVSFPVVSRIYEFLGKHWNEIDTELQSNLQNEPVIWHKNRFWQPSHVWSIREEYTSNELRLLAAHRRAIVQPDKQWKPFLQAVLDDYDSITSHTNLLIEIADECASGITIQSADHTLILHTLNHLGYHSKNVENVKNILQKVAFLPGTDKQLHRLDSIVIAEKSQENLLNIFRDTSLAVLDEQTKLTEDGFAFLRQLGVGLLTVGSCVERELVKVVNKRDLPQLTEKLHMLTGPLRRILQTRKDNDYQLPDYAIDIDRLSHAYIHGCDELQVQYVVCLPSGQRIAAPNTVNVAALIRTNPQQSSLEFYIQLRKDKPNYLAAAGEMARCFIPNSEANIVIEQLLRFKSLEQAHQYLNQRGFLDERGVKPVEDSWDEEDIYDDSLNNGEQIEEDFNIVSVKSPDESFTDDQFHGDYSEDLEDSNVDIFPQGANIISSQLIQNGNEISSKLSDWGGGSNQRNSKRTASSSKQHGIDQHNNRTSHHSISNQSNSAEDNRVTWSPNIDANDAPFNEKPYQPERRTTRERNERQAPKERVDSSDGAYLSNRHSSVNDQMSHADRSAIGRWGEEYVFSHLCKQLKDRYPEGIVEQGLGSCMIKSNNIVQARIDWLNYDQDTGVGRDIVRQENGQTICIEVKATIGEDKSWFYLSQAEWDCAVREERNYHIYRVFSAGDENHVYYTIIDNPVTRWKRGELVVQSMTVQL